jgi:hypothetical protein
MKKKTRYGLVRKPVNEEDVRSRGAVTPEGPKPGRGGKIRKMTGTLREPEKTLDIIDSEFARIVFWSLILSFCPSLQSCTILF